MDSTEDFERSGSSVDGSGGVIAGEYPSCLSEGILPTPPPPPAWTFVTDDNDDATPPPLDIVDPEAVQPPSSAAAEGADGAPSVEETVVNASETSTGLADAGVPTSRGRADSGGLLPARAALLLDTAATDAVDAASPVSRLPKIRVSLPIQAISNQMDANTSKGGLRRRFTLLRQGGKRFVDISGSEKEEALPDLVSSLQETNIQQEIIIEQLLPHHNITKIETNLKSQSECTKAELNEYNQKPKEAPTPQSDSTDIPHQLRKENTDLVEKIRRLTYENGLLRAETNKIRVLVSGTREELAEKELADKEIFEVQYEDILTAGQYYIGISMLVYMFSDLREKCRMGHTRVKMEDIDVNSRLRQDFGRTGKNYLGLTKTVESIVQAVVDELAGADYDDDENDNFGIEDKEYELR